MVNTDIIVGCSFGDEGKGKVVYNLLKTGSYNLCARFNGSGNAGHTIIYEDGEKIVVHQLPVGILVPHIYNLISSDCLVDISRLKTEIDELKSRGIDITGRLFISKSCHIITQECIDYDRQNNKIGTTGSGIGPTFSQKMLRVGKRVEDFADEITALGIEIVDMRKFWFSDFCKQHIHSILMEGAQGFELDINWTNNYPYCTSSTCTIAGAINTGISLKSIKNIIGVSKLYDTYVGTMTFQPEEHNDELNKIGEYGKEFGSTTGRRRQCNFLNLDTLIEALVLNNCTNCIINKCDILDHLQIFKLYHNNKLLTFETLDAMKTYILNSVNMPCVFSDNPNTI
jgi:adenylosuccinate synthase